MYMAAVRTASMDCSPVNVLIWMSSSPYSCLTCRWYSSIFQRSPYPLKAHFATSVALHHQIAKPAVPPVPGDHQPQMVDGALSCILSVRPRYHRFRSRACPSLSCLLYTSDAADDLLCVDLGGRRIIKKK